MTTQRENNEPGTALVVRRLSLVPQGAEKSALELIDEFALAAPSFTEGSEALVTAAENFTVSHQIESQLADDIQDELKRENKDWDGRRLGVTRTLDDLKTYIIGLIKDGITNREKAVAIYQGKISTYRRIVREEEQAKQREAERVLAEERRRLEEEARMKAEEARRQEERARNLKTAEARQKAEVARQQAEDDAQRLREQAEMVPESVALSTSGPVTSASSIAETWEGRIPLCDACKAAQQRRMDPNRQCPHNRKLAVEAILARWEEWGSVIEFRQGSSRDGRRGMDDMARKYKDTLAIPGFEFAPADSFRSKSRK